ncbi:MAG: hypothetical protein M3376_10220 [Actinomycetota bacterium]|nr:hypothetical protein [Actinomycetota bacterium]
MRVHYANAPVPFPALVGELQVVQILKRPAAGLDLAMLWSGSKLVIRTELRARAAP